MSIEYEKCINCERIVQSQMVGHDYHKGYYITAGSRKTLYPFEETEFHYPEGSTWRVYVCQECMYKKSEIIKKLRLERIKKEIDRGPVEINHDQNRIDNLVGKIQRNKERVRKLHEYLQAVENDENLPYDWDELNIEGN